MELAGAILAFGGAVSFAAGAASGLWMHAQMMKAPKDGPPRYTMTLHKEALWSSFLCFAIAGWADEIPWPEPVGIAVAVSIVLTGWFAMGQYFLVAKAGLRNAYDQDLPSGVGLFGKAALIVNLLAVAGLLIGSVLLF